jgi:hypothetical protein
MEMRRPPDPGIQRTNEIERIANHPIRIEPASCCRANDRSNGSETLSGTDP